MGVGDAAVKIETTGIDEIIDQMGKMQQLTGDVAQAMLRAGGNVFQREWISEAEKRKHRKTGYMIKNIGFGKPKTKNGTLQVEVYPQGYGKPQGKRGTRTRNSVKAFVLHHGRAPGPDRIGEIKADEWVKSVVLNATDESNQAMADVWGKFIATGDVPAVKKLSKGKK